MIQRLSEMRKSGRLVGVHVRQGNVNDWHRGYFFGEWENISKDQPTSSPHFCCFDNPDKNLSTCPSNTQTIDAYVAKMQQYPPETMFFVCTDRTGCTLYLHQQFPDRVLMNDIYLETKVVNTYRGFVDFLCLSLCNEIVVSRMSSFADEASRIHDIPITKLQ